MTSPWQGEESGEYFWSYRQDGDIFGWHLSLGVALEVTLLSDIPDMIFLGKQPYVSVFARFLPFLREFIDFAPSTPLIQFSYIFRNLSPEGPDWICTFSGDFERFYWFWPLCGPSIETLIISICSILNAYYNDVGYVLRHHTKSNVRVKFVPSEPVFGWFC